MRSSFPISRIVTSWNTYTSSIGNRKRTANSGHQERSKDRNLAERFWSKVKQFRRAAPRDEKAARNFLAFVRRLNHEPAAMNPCCLSFEPLADRREPLGSPRVGAVVGRRSRAAPPEQSRNFMAPARAWVVAYQC